MIQKIINVIAVFSGLTSALVVGSMVYYAVNEDSLREQARERLTDLISESISEIVLPDVTSGPIGPGMRLP